MCWMTLPDVYPIAHKTSCSEYFKCKQIELIMGLYACADLLYTKVIVHFRCDYVTTGSSYIAGYLNKAIWNFFYVRRYFAQHRFVATYCVCFVENSEPVTLYVKPRLLAVINLNI